MQVNKYNLIALLALCALTAGCNRDRSKKEWHRSGEIADHLYVEEFMVFSSGAYGGDRVSQS